MIGRPEIDDLASDRWQDCWACGGSGESEDCSCLDDTCCCLEPDPLPCGQCDGRGGWTLGDRESA